MLPFGPAKYLGFTELFRNGPVIGTIAATELIGVFVRALADEEKYSEGPAMSTFCVKTRINNKIFLPVMGTLYLSRLIIS